MDITLFLLQLAAMLAVAVVFGQLMRRLGQPAVLGELIGGVILGPALFGWLLPTAYQGLFTANVGTALARDGLVTIGMLFFLFIAGLEINPTQALQSGPKVVATSLLGIAVPFALGFGLVWFIPALWGPLAETHHLALATTIGVALAITALPVIARILVDLGLMQDELATVVLSAAIIDDLIGWTLFALVLSSFTSQGPGYASGMPWLTPLLGGVFVFLVVAGGRWLGPVAFRWIRLYLPWPGGFIAVTAILIFLSAAVAEGIGIHAALGAFFIGVALSQQLGERDQAHEVIYQFAVSFFAPLYFVSVGLKVNFGAGFDLLLVAVVLAVACLGKLGGASLGAWLGGTPPRRALAIGFAMNARGAMELILATVALEEGLIDQRIFVALVFMAIVTSLMSGPALKRLVRVPV
ncbi:MAG TPA: cation:proton antiporter [Anaerolineae bacterium]|nr:cation:proton antiporter [Anaerolineae bacterium]